MDKINKFPYTINPLYPGQILSYKIPFVISFLTYLIATNSPPNLFFPNMTLPKPPSPKTPTYSYSSITQS